MFTITVLARKFKFIFLISGLTSITASMLTTGWDTWDTPDTTTADSITRFSVFSILLHAISVLQRFFLLHGPQ